MKSNYVRCKSCGFCCTEAKWQYNENKCPKCDDSKGYIYVQFPIKEK